MSWILDKAFWYVHNHISDLPDVFILDLHNHLTDEINRHLSHVKIVVSIVSKDTNKEDTK